MKKLLCLIFLFMMLGCNKESENQKFEEKNNIKVEKIEKDENKKDELKEIVNKKGLELVSIKIKSNNEPKIEIEFTESLNDENIDAFIKISPKINYKILKDKSRLIIVGNFKIGENYQIEVLNGIKDIKGNVLEKNIKKDTHLKI